MCPKRYAGSTLTLASLKFLYSPFRLWVAGWVQVLPLTVGAYFSCTHGTLNDELKGQLERLLLVFDRYPLRSIAGSLEVPDGPAGGHGPAPQGVGSIVSWAPTTCTWPIISPTATAAWALASCSPWRWA